MAVEIVALTVEHQDNGFGIGTALPRFSWSFVGSASNWSQTAYDVRISRSPHLVETYTFNTSNNILEPWPSAPLRSREGAFIEVRAHGQSSSTGWASCAVEAGLLERNDWKASLISGPEQDIDIDKQPIRFTTTFNLASTGPRSRLYATAHGIYSIEVNGKRVGDQYLAPGWQSYKHHLNYQVYDLNDHVAVGQNTLVVDVGEGWYAGRLGRPGTRNNFGSRLGLLAQLEANGEIIAATDDTWMASRSPTRESAIYDGETFDSCAASLIGHPAEILPFPMGQLMASDTPPIRVIQTLKAKQILKSTSGETILDFGQNTAGWVRIERDFQGKPGEKLVMRFAEVMENGQLGTRPLRTARCTDTILLGGSTKGWQPKFAWHGFRYLQVTGVDFNADDFTAVVISSDMRRIGHFESSHEMINQLHRNVVWSTIGNFISVPMDCPQRDERLGWTGDLQVYAPTAGFLFDTTGFLGSWLKDVAAEQCEDHNGVVPELVPWIPMFDTKARRYAVWGDVSIITPWTLYMASGDKGILSAQWRSMTTWLSHGVERQADGLWATTDKQFGDWLDVKAPPTYPAHGVTDPILVANAYLVYVTGLIAKIALVLGKKAEAEKYSTEYTTLRSLFRREYVTASGRIVGDSQTALALALRFDLVDQSEKQHVLDRLVWLIRYDSFKVSTGFAGTPILLPTLAEQNRLDIAYRMLQERDCPSWLYPVTMGATTVWERWDSMRPDGSINPGQMTSFNHYALGSVAQFLHETVGGLSALEPGWKLARIAPRPGGTITWATVSHLSPSGTFAVDWKLTDEDLHVKCTVPPHTRAQVVLPGVDVIVGSGTHEYNVKWKVEHPWPPVQLPGPTKIAMPDVFIA